MTRALPQLAHSCWAAAMLAGAIVLLLGSQAAPDCIRDRNGDLWHYFHVANAVCRGQMPYRDFSLEYPPLALAPILLPRLALGVQAAYAQYVWAFLIQSALLTTLLALTVIDIATCLRPSQPPKITALLFTMLSVAAAPVLPWRFDLFPALLTALALRAFLRNRAGETGLWLGLGTAAKLYPLALLAVFAVFLLAERGSPRPNSHRLWGEPRNPNQKGNRLLSLCVLLGSSLVTVGVCLLPFVLLSPGTAFSFLRYHQMRGLEIESGAAGLLLLAHLLRGIPVAVVYNYGADHLASPLSAAILACLPLLFLALLAGLLLHFRRQSVWEPAAIPRALSLVLLTALLVNKVFSPQYLLWLLPFAPLLRLREAILLLVVFGLTALLILLAFPGLLALHTAPILLLNLRNLLVAVSFGALLIRPQAIHSQFPLPRGDTACVQH